MLQQGVLFETAEGPLIFRGTITVCCADNLGSHALGNFKELLLPGIGGCSTESICSLCSFKKQLLLVLPPSLYSSLFDHFYDFSANFMQCLCVEF